MSDYAVCKVSTSPMRADLCDASEMINQLLFGEPLEIIESNKQWRKVRSLVDAYEGWVDEKQILSLREKEIFRWMDGLGSCNQLIEVIESNEGKITLSLGAFLPEEFSSEFNIGKAHYTRGNTEKLNNLSFEDTALRLLNTPYLWGGKSPFGIDCSGLTQLSARLKGLKIPRDAYQQAEEGIEIPFGDHQAGDLAFFINDSGRIHHVGILKNEAEIIHAHGYVRIDRFSEAGITRKLDAVFSHKLHSIRRIF